MHDLTNLNEEKLLEGKWPEHQSLELLNYLVIRAVESLKSCRPLKHKVKPYL